MAGQEAERDREEATRERDGSSQTTDQGSKVLVVAETRVRARGASNPRQALAEWRRPGRQGAGACWARMQAKLLWPSSTCQNGLALIFSLVRTRCASVDDWLMQGLFSLFVGCFC